MAKYTVTHSCGHTETHELFGAMRERDRKVAWYETVPCSKCYRGEVKPEVMLSSTLDMLGVVGDTYPLKDALKAAGLEFGDYSLDHPERGWHKAINLGTAEGKAAVAVIVKALSAIGITSYRSGGTVATAEQFLAALNR